MMANLSGISKKWKRISAAILALILALLLFVGGIGLGKRQADTQLAELISTIDTQYEQIETVRNQKSTLMKELDTAGEEQEILLTLIQELKARPPEIQYVVKTHTVVEPGEPIYISPDLPDKHVYELDNGLAVARFENGADGYEFETYALDIDHTLVISDTHTSSSVFMGSSADPTWRVEVSHKTHTADLSTPVHKVIGLDLAIGLTAQGPVPSIMASLTLPWLHPTPTMDLLTPRLSGGSQALGIGIDILSYNVGTHIPVLDNIWVAPTIGIDTLNPYSVGLTVSAKL